MRCWVATGILVLAAAPGWATLVRSVEPVTPEASGQLGPVREVTALPCGSPVTVDGVLDEPCWQSGTWIGDLLLNDGRGRRAPVQTYFKVRFDAGNLHIGVRADEPNMAGLREFFGAAHDDKVFNDDCIELWVDPDNLRSRAFHQIFSVAGGTYDELQREEVRFDPTSPAPGAVKPLRRTDLSWDANAEAAFRRAENGWSAELRLPVGDFGVPQIVPGSVWALNLARERWAAPRGVELSSLTGVSGGPMSAFADLRLGVSPIEVGNLDMGGLGVGEGRLTFDIRSPREEIDAVDVRLTVQNGEQQTERRFVQLVGRASRSVELPYELKPAGACALTLEILDPGSGALLFRRCSRRALESALRVRPRTGLAYRRHEPFWVDVELVLGNVSAARGVLQAELISPKGRRVARQRLREPYRAMRLHLRLGAAGRDGTYTLRFSVLEEGRELGAVSVPVHVIRR